MKRKLLVLALTLMLVVSMAVPAFAVSYTEDYGGYDYTCTLVTNVSKSTATMSYGLFPFTLNIAVRNKVTIQSNGKTVWGQYYTYSSTSPVSGTANNYVTVDGSMYYGEVKQGNCKYYFGPDLVYTLNAYPS